MSVQFTSGTGNNFVEFQLLGGFIETSFGLKNSFFSPPVPIFDISLTPSTISISNTRPNSTVILNQTANINFASELGGDLSFIQFYFIGERLIILGFDSGKTTCVQIANLICYDIWKVCQIGYVVNDVVFGSVLTAQNDISFQNTFNDPSVTNVLEALKSTKNLYGANFNDSLTSSAYYICNGSLGDASIALITLMVFLVAAFVLGFAIWTFVYEIPVF
jgi:hypothetical protein